MNPRDFRKLLGTAHENDYLPVACMLASGYGCVGFYNERLNSELEDTCVLLNARLVKLSRGETGQRLGISDFNSFIEEIVARDLDDSEGHDVTDHDELLGSSIPLTAIPFEQIVIVYPISQIAALIRQAEPDASRTPTFLDFDNKSVVLKVLRTKLW